MARPRDRADHDAVATTAHPRRLGLHKRPCRAEVQCPPASTALTHVKARRPSPTDAAAITLPPGRPSRHDDLSLIADPHVLDDRPLQTQQARPYPCSAHVVSALLGSSP
jgi:hypothetical protein